MSSSVFRQLTPLSCPQTQSPAQAIVIQEDTNRIAEPGRLDVLCGKEKVCVQHEGSKRFRIVIESYRDLYSEALTKFDKMTITREIYEGITATSSRFLKFNEESQAWDELEPMAARDKIGHSLRFANRKRRRTSKNSSKSSGNLSKSSSSDTVVSDLTSDSQSHQRSSRSASPRPNCMYPMPEIAAAPVTIPSRAVTSMEAMMSAFDTEVGKIDQSSGYGSVDCMVDEWISLSCKDTDLMALYQQIPSANSCCGLVDIMAPATSPQQQQQQRQLPATGPSPCRHHRLTTHEHLAFLNDPVVSEWDIDMDISHAIFA